MIIGTTFLLIALQVHADHAAHAPAASAIEKVAIAPEFFNPSLGQVAKIVYTTTDAGTVTVSILDRDGFPVRRLPPSVVEPGNHEAVWDGKDDRGSILPDEAYTPRLELAGAKGTALYDPREGFHSVIEEPEGSVYSRLNGVLTYKLSRSCRVHSQAGQAKVNPKTGKQEGPILKTLVDRQPRVGGSIVEKWNGFDESGKIYVPDLPNFGVSILATSLPANTIITIGNPKASFLQYAREHRPPSAQEPRALQGEGHSHHAGMTTFEDHSPALTLEASLPITNGTLTHRAGADLTLRATLDPNRAPYFLRQPNSLAVFLNETAVLTRAAPSHPAVLKIPGSKLRPGEYRLAVNWGSKLGPVAVQVFRLVVEPAPPKSRGGQP